MAHNVIFDNDDQHCHYNQVNQTNINHPHQHSQHINHSAHIHKQHCNHKQRCNHNHNHHHHHHHHTIKMENNLDVHKMDNNNNNNNYQIKQNKQFMKQPSGMNNNNNNNNDNNKNNYFLDDSHQIKQNNNDSNSKLQFRQRIFVSYHDKQNNIFGCKHYARNCFIKADCCNQWYVCRFCHDERNENHGLNGRLPHQINRYATKYVKCMRCGTEQPISQNCINCTVEIDHFKPSSTSDPSQIDAGGGGHNNNNNKQIIIKQERKTKQEDDDGDDISMMMMSDDDGHSYNNNNNNIKQEKLIKKERKKIMSKPYSFGRYYCDICKFHDDKPGKEIFHCLECGLCRLGRQTDYIHCQRCGCCLNYKYYAKHPCIENSLKSDCPICFTYLFKSREPVTFFMPCGHPIHYDCLLQYAKVGNWKCPICRTGWYDEQSEKRKKIVQAIKQKSQIRNENIILHQTTTTNTPGQIQRAPSIIITNPAANINNNASPPNINLSQFSPVPPHPPINTNNSNNIINNNNDNLTNHNYQHRQQQQQ